MTISHPKFLYAILLIFTFGSISLSDFSENKLSINGIVDSLIDHLRKVLIQDGYDPMILPDYQTSILHLGVLGKLEISNCHLYNATTMQRSRGVEYHKADAGIDVATGLSFGNIKINCTYDASLVTLITTTVVKKTGAVVVNLPNLSAEVDINVQRKGFKPKVHLNNMHLVNNGEVDVHLEGGLLDIILSALTEAISYLVSGVMIEKIEYELTNKIRNITETPCCAIYY